MNPIARDATLATVSGVALLALLAVTDSLTALARPSAAAGGILAALGVEWLFLGDTPAAELWDRHIVRTGSVIGLVVGAVVAAVAGGPWLVAAACWGGLTYFLLLGLLLAGVWPSDGHGSNDDGSDDDGSENDGSDDAGGDARGRFE